MVMVKFRSTSEAKDLLKKMKKMHKYTKEIIECFEDKMNDDEEYDDDEDYRYDDDDERMERMRKRSEEYRGRYRRSM